MTVCPVAIVAGCRKCPVFKLCPLKGVLGDQVKADEASRTEPPRAASKRAARKSG